MYNIYFFVAMVYIQQNVWEYNLYSDAIPICFTGFVRSRIYE